MSYKKKNANKAFWHDARTIVLYVAGMFLLLKVIFVVAYIPTGSMKPTINEDSAVIGWRLCYLLSDPMPERGEIIIFNHEEFDGHLVKRVIGLPGDDVCIIMGKVFVNGKELEENYLAEPGNIFYDEEFLVPEGQLFVLGDNRNHSNDSRFWNNHFVKIEAVYAKVILRINWNWRHT